MFQKLDLNILRDIFRRFEGEWRVREVCKFFHDTMGATFPIGAVITHGIINGCLSHVYVHPVKLELVFSDRDDWGYVPFPNITKLHVWSEKTGNCDVRGGGCGDLWIPREDFQYKIDNPGGITARDIIECVYRLKGSKYDLWYEFYTGVLNFDIVDQKLKFQVRFDYGS